MSAIDSYEVPYIGYQCVISTSIVIRIDNMAIRNRNWCWQKREIRTQDRLRYHRCLGNHGTAILLIVYNICDLNGIHNVLHVNVLGCAGVDQVIG